MGGGEYAHGGVAEGVDISSDSDDGVGEDGGGEEDAGGDAGGAGDEDILSRDEEARCNVEISKASITLGRHRGSALKRPPGTARTSSTSTSPQTGPQPCNMNPHRSKKRKTQPQLRGHSISQGAASHVSPRKIHGIGRPLDSNLAPIPAPFRPQSPPSSFPSAPFAFTSWSTSDVSPDFGMHDNDDNPFLDTATTAIGPTPSSTATPKARTQIYANSIPRKSEQRPKHDETEEDLLLGQLSSLTMEDDEETAGRGVTVEDADDEETESEDSDDEGEKETTKNAKVSSLCMGSWTGGTEEVCSRRTRS